MGRTAQGFNAIRSQAWFLLSDRLAITYEHPLIPAAESPLRARPDAISILQTENYGSRDWRERECCVTENPLIVGPRRRSSKVLRDTIGERFLFDQKRSRFVNEFVPRHWCSRTQIVTSKISAGQFYVRILSLQ